MRYVWLQTYFNVARVVANLQKPY